MLKGLRLTKIFTIIFGLFLTPAVLAAADYWQLNMYKGVTPLSKEMYDLHVIAMVVCALIGIVVFGVMIFSLIYHRKSKGYVAASFHDHTWLEILWSVIPFLILVALAVPATKVLFRMQDTRDADLTIKIVGSQWKWQYQYLDQGISFYSNLATPYDQIHNKEKKGQWYLLEVDKPLVLPIHRKIRFLVTSNDVVHSWWVPELGIKRDAMPGFMYEAWASIDKPGVYRGQCTELCGINHGFMPIVVSAVSDQEFSSWLSKQEKNPDIYAEGPQNGATQKTLSQAELMQTGKTKYEQVCLACHKADGKGQPPLFPALKGSSVSTGKPISRHISLILHGVPGTAMQAYKDQLSDEEIAAIVTYERNAWENNTGDVVQPDDVKKLRNIKAAKLVNKARVGGLR